MAKSKEKNKAAATSTNVSIVSPAPKPWQFQPGNPGGPGNPYARQIARLRSTLVECVSPEDLKEIVRVLIEKAKAGDIAAAREIIDRVLGKPLPSDLEERLAMLEEQLERSKEGK